MRSIIRGLIAVVLLSAAVMVWAPEIRAQQVSAGADADTAEIDARLVAAKGAWNKNTTYKLDDLVTSRGSTWRSKHASNKNHIPGSTQPNTAAHWELFAAGFNPTGAWVGGARKYHRNDLVTRNGETWRAKRTNHNKQPVPGANWERFAAKGSPGPNTGVPDGTVSAPGISFNGDANTGIFSPANGKIALVEDGVLFLHNNGTQNTALGAGALLTSTGSSNTAVGDSALGSNTTGTDNTAVGGSALSANTTGGKNAALGFQALLSNTTGPANTAVGEAALKSNIDNGNNTAVGNAALRASTGGGNTALGSSTLLFSTTGGNNVAVGLSALAGNSTGSSNVGVGNSALQNNAAGTGNIALGNSAGSNPTPVFNSIFIGNTGVNGATDTATIKIGVQGTQNRTLIAGISGVNIGTANDAPVLIDTVTGQLGTIASSRRYKEDIVSMSDKTAMLTKLRPVTFRYKKPRSDGSKPIQYGLIAEEVADVFPALAVFNEQGQPETVKYHLLPNFLLAGYQQQQKVIETQATRIDTLEQRLATLEAKLGRLAAR